MPPVPFHEPAVRNVGVIHAMLQGATAAIDMPGFWQMARQLGFEF